MISIIAVPSLEPGPPMISATTVVPAGRSPVAISEATASAESDRTPTLTPAPVYPMVTA